MIQVTQIINLIIRVRALEDGRTFLAVWTAPGDDYDHGSVSGYRFVYSSNISALLDGDSSRAETLLQFQRPDSAGVQTSYQFEFEHYNRYFRILLDMSFALYCVLLMDLCRLSHLVVHLDLVDLESDYSIVCLIMHCLVDIWQKWGRAR